MSSINKVNVNGTTYEIGGSGGGGTWDTLTGKPFSTVDHGLKVVDNKLQVDTVDTAEADNTKPITSKGVHTIVGNIEVLLGAI